MQKFTGCGASWTGENPPIRQVDFVRLREDRVLAVFVSQAGLVTNKLVQLDFDVVAVFEFRDDGFDMLLAGTAKLELFGVGVADVMQQRVFVEQFETLSSAGFLNVEMRLKAMKDIKIKRVRMVVQRVFCGVSAM